jgi:ribose transport system substrate-binding protein
MARFRIALIALLPVLAATLPACNSKPAGVTGNRPKVAFVSNNPESFWTICEAGCNQAAAEAGVECIFRKPQSGNPAQQKEIIDALVNQDVKAIAVSVIDPKNQTAYIDTVVGKGVPFLAVDNDAPESKRTCYIGTDNYSAGRAAGKLVKKALPNGGTIAIFVGQLEALNARQRRQGLLDELAGTEKPADVNAITPTEDGKTYGKYKLHKTYLDQPEGGARGKQNAAAALTELADEKDLCLIGLWAYNPPGILSATADKKKLGQVKIVGFDEDMSTLGGVADGNVVATIVQNPFEFGAQAVKTMAALAKGESYKGDVVRYVPFRILTKDGGDGTLPVAPFRADLQKILRSAR